MSVITLPGVLNSATAFLGNAAVTSNDFTSVGQKLFGFKTIATQPGTVQVFWTDVVSGTARSVASAVTVAANELDIQVLDFPTSGGYNVVYTNTNNTAGTVTIVVAERM